MSGLVSSFPLEQRTLRLRDLQLYAFVAAFAVGNLLLPMAVHAVPQGGLIFLPIFFCTLLAAYRFGITAGVLTAIASPLLNHLLTGMPPSELLFSVLAKSLVLAAFAAILALRTARLSPWSLLLAASTVQIAGLALDVARGTSLAAGLDAFRLGIPGVLIMGFGGYAVLRLLARTGIDGSERDRR